MTTPSLPPPTRVPARPYRRPRPRVPDTLRLDGNEGSRPPAELLATAAALPIEALREYPDLTALQETVAARHSVTPEQVVVTAGADGAMERVFRSFVDPGDRVLVPVPTFEMIHRFAAISGGEVETVPWSDRFPLAALEARMGDRTALVVVVSPNNPTGQVVEADELRRLAAAAAARGAILLFDHVYAEYADQDLTDAALELENVVVLRTLSKAWGLAGCRVGYALAGAELAAVLRGAGNPYPIAALSAEIARRRLETGAGEMERHVARVRRERQELHRRLAERGIPSRPSQGNFVLADLGRRAVFVDRALASLGVLVRTFPHRAEIADSLRISLPGDGEAFQRLLSALATALEPEALLFDLDGVLADVRASYRRAILATAASFGVALEPADVAAAKRAGNANNDWALTRALLAERGVDVPLAEVKRRFQELYLGSPERPGLRRNERLLVDKRRLAAWAGRLPLAVVTGRPRDEAEWFLERHDVRSLFATLVCLEDAPPKPDPAPVARALGSLGVERAWMLGDTPDDLVAARRAGALPVAVMAPGEEDPETAAALEAAGAAALLTDISKLEELL